MYHLSEMNSILIESLWKHVKLGFLSRECNLVCLEVGTSSWGTPGRLVHLQVCFLAPNKWVAVWLLARDPVLKVQPYRVWRIGNQGVWKVRSQKAQMKLFECVSQLQLILLTCWACACSPCPGCARVFKGHALKDSLLWWCRWITEAYKTLYLVL